MDEDLRVRPYARLFIFMSVLFFIDWGSYCIQLWRMWHRMDRSIQVDSIGFAMLFCALWVFMFRERSSGLAFTVAAFAFAAAARTLVHGF